MGDDDNCIDFGAKDSIAFLVNIGNYKVDILDIELPYCSKEGDEVDMTIHLSNPALVVLDPSKNDSVQITFNAATKAAGFQESNIRIQGDTIFIIRVPATAKNNTEYGLHLHIGSECPNSVLDKDLEFSIHFNTSYLTQRYNNVLGIVRDSFPAQEELTDFIWIHDGDTLYNERTSVLYLDEKDPKNSGEYIVCFTIKEEGKPDRDECSCPITFNANADVHSFEADSTGLNITAYYAVLSGGVVFVNADYKGETDIPCYARWINANGQVYQNMQFDIPDGGCTIPAPKETGLYLLHVVTGKGSRSFKFTIQ
jgi:archaellum component FlaF (FlaF/FlaG flagellin family)